MKNNIKFPLAYEIERSGTNNESVLHSIFPTKQVLVDAIIEWAKETNAVEKVIVFGSALDMSCGIGSDLDIALKISGGEDEDVFYRTIRPIRRKFIEDSIDWINLDEIVGSGLEIEIQTKGMQIYECECTRRFSA